MLRFARKAYILMYTDILIQWSDKKWRELCQSNRLTTRFVHFLAIVVLCSSIFSLRLKFDVPASVEPNSSSNIGISCPQYGYVNGRWITENATTDGTTNRWSVANTTECRLEPWDPTAFCNVVNGRNILVVGDSVNDFLFKAIVVAFGSDIKTEQAVYVNSKRSNVSVQFSGTICRTNKQSTTVTFIRNDHLLLSDSNNTSSSLMPWTHLLKSHEITILNTGAHPISYEIYENNLRALKSFLDDNYRNGLVLFRTTPRGHRRCGDYTYPIELYSKEWFELFDLNQQLPSDDMLLKFGWWMFPKYNTIAKNVFTVNDTDSYVTIPRSVNDRKKRSPPYYAIIDIATIVELRPDIHVPEQNDCLHYSTFAPFVFWLELLLNALHGFIQY